MLYGIDFYNGEYILKRKEANEDRWWYLQSFRQSGQCHATWTGVKEQAWPRNYYEVADILKWFIDRNPHLVTSVLVEIDD